MLTLLLLSACDSPCLGDYCKDVPEIPWDPGQGGSSDGYGYGYGGDGADGSDGADGTDGGWDSDEPPREILTRRNCTVRVEHVPDGSPSSVQIAGEFNDWSPQDLNESGGVWSLDLGELPPGDYAHKFILDGAWEGEPPSDVYSKWLGGTENRALRVGDCTRPLLQTVSASATSTGALQAEVQIASAADGSPIDAASLQVEVGGRSLSASEYSFDAESGLLSLSLNGLAPGKHSLRVRAADEAGRRAENEPLWVPLWVEDQEWQWRDSLLYFVFTDRFRDADSAWGPIGGTATCADYNGGDFLGVIAAIEEGYFEALGVNTLWLSPIYENPDANYLGTDGTHYYSGYHGYWPTSGEGIEDRWGDGEAGAEERLQELIEVAHAHGIRVMFDLVLNHVHEEHAYIDEHPEWFSDGCVCGTSGCDWDSHAVECWFTDYLPDLSYKNHELVQRVTDDTLHLLQTYDVDGIRVDAAKHMDHVIMRTLSMRIRDEVEAGGGARIYSVGETFTSDRDLIMDYVSPTELDGQFDFPLYFSIRSAFVDDGSFRDLESSVSSSVSTYGGGLMSPFLGNHDVERFATAVTGASGDCWSGWLEDPMAEGSSVTEWDLINRQSMALAFTLTQPGVPLLYYGDEIGLHGGGDPDNRRQMNFAPYLSANQEELLTRTQAIGRARAESEALRRGERVQLWVDDGLLIYALDNGGGDVAIVAMNKGSSSRTETVDVGDLGASGATWQDRKLSTRSFTASGANLTLTLGSWDYAILVRE
jgi:neopullulanase